MHIETLKVFCDIVELGSFSKTADKHLLSQSAISQQLAQLEVLHKCQLVNRKKRPIELTKAGRLLYAAAKDILDRYEQFRTEINALRSESQGRLNVGAIFSIGMHTLRDYVKRFMVSYPEVNVHIEYLDAIRIYEGILSGALDIGLVAVPKRDRRLEVFDFEEEELVFVCSPKHRLAGEASVDIHQLQSERLVTFEKDLPSRVWIDGLLARYNVVIQATMEFDNIETIKRAIEINSGVGILPRNAVRQELSGRTLVAIPFSNEHFVRPTGIIVRKGRVLGKAGEFFIEVLRSGPAGGDGRDTAPAA